MGTASVAEVQWKSITPAVHSEAEFLEIANDFGNPLEILREAISNAIDAKAKNITISFEVDQTEDQLIISLVDDGVGMSEETLIRDFWGLGFSSSRQDAGKIGEKGHGTKIYLRSEKVEVRTHHETGAFLSECERPFKSLAKGKVHAPRLTRISKCQEGTGTEIKVYGYNKDQRGAFFQENVKDYLVWFTKFGSIEQVFGITDLKDVSLKLKCLDKKEYEVIPFGHLFPAENTDINSLFTQYNANAADYFVKKYLHKEPKLERFPEASFELIISVEGDQAKRNYNSQLGIRRRKDSGRYKVGDRYGIWLCKDYIPIQRVNEWVSGFGTGSNSITLLHGFINCQQLKLTANRGSIANTNSELLDELKKVLQLKLDSIDADLRKEGIFTLFEWQTEERTIAQEKADFDSRVKSIGKRKRTSLNGQEILEPRTEAELFGLFMRVQALHPELFPFSPMDYNTSRGIDMIARNRTNAPAVDPEFSYVELKNLLRPELNHGFKHLRWILCWDFDKGVGTDSEFFGVQDPEVRKLEISSKDGKTVYFLNAVNSPNKVQIIRLKEVMKEQLTLEFATAMA